MKAQSFSYQEKNKSKQNKSKQWQQQNPQFITTESFLISVIGYNVHASLKYVFTTADIDGPAQETALVLYN